MSIKDWELQQNIVSIKEQEEFYLKVQQEDALQTMKDTETEMNERELIKQKIDRAYLARNGFRYK